MRKRGICILLSLLLLAAAAVGCRQNGERPTDSGTDSTARKDITTVPETEETPVPVTPEGDFYRFTAAGVTLTVDLTTGLVTDVETGAGALSCRGILADVGIGGTYAEGSLSYQGYDGISSSGLPTVSPKADYLPGEAAIRLSRTTDTLYIDRESGGVTVQYRYRLSGNQAELTVRIPGGGQRRVVNGVAFEIIGMSFGSGVTYEYPGNLPAGKFAADCRRPGIPNETLFPGAVTHFADGGKHLNICFLDDTEKWTTGVWRSKTGELSICNLAAVECRLGDGDEIAVGSLAIRFPEATDDAGAYADVKAYYREKGYGISGDVTDPGPILCGHPGGTSDTDYLLQEDFDTFAKRLDRWAEIGIGTFWCMPVNPHKGKSDLYSPTGLAGVDERLGGSAALKRFVDAAHGKGIRVLLDIVIHGLPTDAIGQEQKSWVCRSRAGTVLTEWGDPSFDYGNSAYQKYMRGLMRDFVTEWGIDGIRVDSASGSRPNWSRTDGKRPSASTLLGGVEMAGALADGFRDAGKEAIQIPEMFYAIPSFSNATPYYYNNSLYRVLMDLNANYRSDRTVYTQRLLEFLSVQYRTRVDGQVNINWLENHDTVLWSGDRMRAVALYGEDWAKNMFRMISWIDGVPVLYMGDENAAAYGVGENDLGNFFREIFAFRQEHLTLEMETEYIASDKPVFAFTRGGEYLMLLNFSGEAQTFHTESGTVLYADGGSWENNTAELEGYGCLVLRLKGETR